MTMSSFGPFPDRHFSRRQALQLSGLAALCLADSKLLPPGVCLADQASAPARPTPLNRFPRMVQEYFVEQVRHAEEQGIRARAALKTKADAEAYVRAVQE